MNTTADIEVVDPSEPLTSPVDAYISREYAEAEAERLWANVWQHAGRVEDVPEVGDYITWRSPAIRSSSFVPRPTRSRPITTSGLRSDGAFPT